MIILIITEFSFDHSLIKLAKDYPFEWAIIAKSYPLKTSLNSFEYNLSFKIAFTITAVYIEDASFAFLKLSS